MNQKLRAEAARVRARSDELFKEYAKTHDPVLRQKLIDAHESLVHYLAGKFANRGEPLEDLVSVGNLALVKAVDRFDPSRGTKFSTFATPTIIGEIRRYFRDKAWGLRVPRRLQELNQAASKASVRLAQKLGRSPTVEEISGAINATEEDTLAALELAHAYETLSVDSMPADGDPSALPLQDSLGAADESLENLELYDDLKRALNSLGDRERNILYYRFFRDLSQIEVAQRLNISQMHVSRLQKTALRRLKQLLAE